ncbi:hypothetical protein [Rhodococcoides kyotonense]|uniref:hypothetical protein n=1 Tax=Rhodococcoides kyotonense TaxID=398843 RepID=UPI000AD2996A|nr:hypothetical protein [Rhodococcus kyotonensis]
MGTTYLASDGSVTLNEQGLTLNHNARSKKGTQAVTIPYSSISSVTFLVPGLTAPGIVTFNVRCEPDEIFEQSNRNTLRLDDEKAAEAAREYVAIVRSVMAGNSASPIQPEVAIAAGRVSSPRTRPAGVPRNRCLPNGVRLIDLDWPPDPSPGQTNHGYVWNGDKQKWVKAHDPNGLNGWKEWSFAGILGVGAVAVIIGIIALLGTLFSGSDDSDGRCETLQAWYNDNPYDSNPSIADDYYSSCGQVPPPVQNGELISRNGHYVYP